MSQRRTCGFWGMSVRSRSAGSDNEISAERNRNNRVERYWKASEAPSSSLPEVKISKAQSSEAPDATISETPSPKVPEVRISETQSLEVPDARAAESKSHKASKADVPSASSAKSNIPIRFYVDYVHPVPYKNLNMEDLCRVTDYLNEKYNFATLPTDPKMSWFVGPVEVSEKFRQRGILFYDIFFNSALSNRRVIRELHAAFPVGFIERDNGRHQFSPACLEKLLRHKNAADEQAVTAKTYLSVANPWRPRV